MVARLQGGSSEHLCVGGAVPEPARVHAALEGDAHAREVCLRRLTHLVEVLLLQPVLDALDRAHAQPLRARHRVEACDGGFRLEDGLDQPELVTSGVNREARISSIEPLTMCCPSGLTATERTPSVCPCSVRTAAPSARRQTRTVLSHEPLTMCCPSGLTATEYTPFVCPSSVRTAAPPAMGTRGDGAWCARAGGSRATIFRREAEGAERGSVDKSQCTLIPLLVVGITNGTRAQCRYFRRL